MEGSGEGGGGPANKKPRGFFSRIFGSRQEPTLAEEIGPGPGGIKRGDPNEVKNDGTSDGVRQLGFDKSPTGFDRGPGVGVEQNFGVRQDLGSGGQRAAIERSISAMDAGPIEVDDAPDWLANVKIPGNKK